MNKISKKWLLSLLVVLVVAVGLVGCTDTTDTQTGDPDAGDKVEDAADDVKEKADDTAKNVEEDVRDMNYDDIKLKPEEAFDKFMELHPNAKVKDFELDKGLMEYEYVIEGYDNENEYEVKINPVDGEVISDEEEIFDIDDEDENEEITREHLAKVDSLIDMAIEEDGSDSELDEWNISVDDGRVEIEIEIGATEYSYDMDTEELIEKDM